MSETRYTIELAKSGRSKCSKCKQVIQSKEMRIGSHSTSSGDDFAMSKWTHVECFKLPQKYTKGANKMSVEEFVRGVLEDTSSEHILSKNVDEVIAKIENASKTRKSSGGAAAAAAGDTVLADLKAAYDKDLQDVADGKEPSSKKSKSNLSLRLDAYGRYKACKVAELQDMLGYNRQIKKGSKDFLLAKVVDGAVFGRLSHCHLCGGRLKMKEDGEMIECAGTFDEGSQRRIACSFTCTVADAPRWQPWYETEPNEEEAQAMDDLIKKYEEAQGVPAESNYDKDGEDDDTKKLVQAVSQIEWDLTSKVGIKSAVNALHQVLVADNNSNKENNNATAVATTTTKTLDLPDDAQQARMKILETVNMNRDKSADEMIPILIQEFGWAEVKAAKKAHKQAALEKTILCESNAGIVAALKELSELYMKEGNRNAGGSYFKAVGAISALNYAITEKNAKGLCKGKTKVASIGKGTADKIHEFITTGTIAKLDEKRADAA